MREAPAAAEQGVNPPWEGGRGTGCDFWMPFTWSSRKAKQIKKKKVFCPQKQSNLLLSKNVYTSKVFQFQLMRKVAAKINAPERVQAEHLWDLDGRKLDTIRLCCAC